MDNSVDESYLQDWYQASIDTTEPPVWTDEHISELCKDFYVIPKEFKTMSKIELSEYLAKNGNVTVDENELDKLLGVEHEQGGMPKINEVYWFITSDGDIGWAYWRNNEIDQYRYYTLNCFETEEEAEKAKEAKLMHGKLMRYAEEHNEDEHSHLLHCVSVKDGDIYKYRTALTEYGIPQFTSEEILEAAIESVGRKDEVLRVLYGVETKEQ